jgi:hypothetical protein
LRDTCQVLLLLLLLLLSVLLLLGQLPQQYLRIRPRHRSSSS